MGQRRGGGLHGCVAYAGKIVNDPHPSQAGLLRQDEIGLLMPLDPSLRKRRSAKAWRTLPRD